MEKSGIILILIEEFAALKERIIANVIANNQSASGRTISSLDITNTSNSVTLLNVGKGAPFFGLMETGRKAGNVPRGFQAIILQWMKDKNLSGTPIPYVRVPSARWQPKYDQQTRGDMSMAGAIAYKIKTEGTKLHRDGGRTDVYSNEIPETIENVRERIYSGFIDQIQTIKLNWRNEIA